MTYGKPDRRRSLSYDQATGWYRCFRCKTVGRIDSPDGPAYVAPVENSAPLEISPPEGFELLSEELEQTSHGGFLAGQYLRSRNVFPHMWKALGIGACLSGAYYGRVVVPIMDSAGKWLGWVGRVWAKKAETPYYYPPGMKRGNLLYNRTALDLLIQDPILVVEGVFDAIHLWPDGVAVLGKPSLPQLDMLLSSSRPVVFVLDGDAHDEAWGLMAKFRLAGKPSGYIKLPALKDPDDFDPEEIREMAATSLLQPV